MRLWKTVWLLIVCLALGGTALAVGETDLDSDGFPDPSDACPDSDLSPTVEIRGCETGVANQMLFRGCSFSDRLSACSTLPDGPQAGIRQRPTFQRCGLRATARWTKRGRITPSEQMALNRCIAPPVQGQPRFKPMIDQP